MNDTITDLVDNLVEAIDNEDAERARDLIGAIGDKYDEIAAEEEKRIRQATILREDGEAEEELGELVSTSANTEMKRGAFLLRAVTAVREIEQGSSPNDFDEAVSDVKNADEELETQVNNSEPIIQESDIPPSIEIVRLGVDSSTIELNQTAQLVATVANVGDKSAENIETTLDAGRGLTLPEVNELPDLIGGQEEKQLLYEIEGTEAGEYRARYEVTSANGGSDIDSVTITIVEEQDSTVKDYTDEDSIVKLSGLREAIADWRSSEISDALLADVAAAWRSQDNIN